MANGVLVLCSLADEVDQLCLASEGRKRITLLDIGGGLSANYSDEKVSPTFDAYLEAILKVYPGFHTQGRTIVTGINLVFPLLLFASAYSNMFHQLLLWSCRIREVTSFQSRGCVRTRRGYCGAATGCPRFCRWSIQVHYCYPCRCGSALAHCLQSYKLPTQIPSTEQIKGKGRVLGHNRRTTVL